MSLKRTVPISGIAFIVFFFAGVAVSNVPSNTATDKAWTAAYATHAKQAGHLATGVLLVLAGLCLMAFLTSLWNRIRAASQAHALSPLPIVAAGVSAACIATGGISMAATSGSALLYSQPIPAADVLRLGNDLGFAMVGVAGMFAAALSVATISTQAHAAGLFGTALRRFSLAVAVVLLASIAFIPILALAAWLLATTVALTRAPRSQANPLRPISPSAGDGQTTQAVSA